MSLTWQIVGSFYRRKKYGRDDIIYNTMVKIVYDKDKSKWAHEALEACANLLLRKNRWPEYMDKGTDKKTIIGWWLYSRILRKLFPKMKKYTRCRKDMTRDPYTAFYRCCVHLDRMQFIECIRMPIRLWRPEVWKWRRRLIRQHKKLYVQRLRHLRAGAIYNMGENQRIYDSFCKVVEY